MNFDEESKLHLKCYNKNYLGIKEEVEYRGHMYSHILSLKNREKNFQIPIEELDFDGPNLYFKSKSIKQDPIKLHSWGTHLNSSQILCINFFYDFIKDKDKLQKLVNYFDIGNPTVESACFEYGLCDDSEIDFCILLKNKKRIYCEIKYKETFGGVSDKKNPKYRYKKKKFYSAADISYEDYCKDYQFIRNIWAGKRDNSYAIFIFPERNETACRHFKRCLDNLNNKEAFNYKKVYWEELITKFPNKKIKDKYFWYLNDNK